MIHRIVIPQAFENMEEATIGAWSRREGDSIAVGEALCELITEKTTFDLPAEKAGILRRIVIGEKSIVPVGTVIGIIGDADDEIPDVAAENDAAREMRPVEAVPPAEKLVVPNLATSNSAPSNSAPAAGGSRLRATPAARRAARERGVELEDVAARFPNKVLSEDDVQKFVDNS